MKTEELKNPGAQYRGKPFWAWNGKQETGELLKQIDQFAQMGFGGFFIHSRTGLITDYLGDKWFEQVRICAKYAYEKGLQAWLYDEDRWPSGTCGGLVTKNPEYRAKYISEYDCDADLPVLGRFAVREDPLDYFPVASAAEVPSGYAYKCYVIEEMAPSDFYNGYTYLDTMNKEAVEAYIRSTHELYREKTGDLFGKEIVGIFTDEPHRSGIFSKFSITNPNADAMCPYTPGLFDAYRAQHGEDLKANLPALYYAPVPNRTAAKYVETLERLFVHAYADTYGDFCKKNNLIFTGHVLHEDSLAAQTVMSGSMMRFYGSMDYPGIDNLSMTNNCYQAAVQCVSVARQKGKKMVLSEMYAASGWDSGLEQFKQVGDWQAFFGVTLRCPHLAWYTMRGEAKRDFPQSILQSSIRESWRAAEDYFARLSYLTVHTRRVCSTLLVDPVERMWTQVRKGWADGLSATGAQALDLEDAYTSAVQTLISRHVFFDLGGEEDLAGAEVVQGASGPALKVGEQRYETVIFDGGDCRETTRAVLKAFLEAGGKVLRSAREAEPDMGVKADEKLAVTLYGDGSDYWLLVMNFDREKDVADTEISVELAGYKAQEFDLKAGCVTGGVYDAAKIPTTVYRGGERLYRLTKEKLTAIAEKDAPELTLSGEYPYDLCEPNALVLDRAKVTGEDGTEIDGYVLDADVALRKKLGLPLRGTEMLQPWFKRRYQPDLGGKGLKITVEYTFGAETLPKSCRVAYEGDFTVTVNGQAGRTLPEEYWTDSCFRLCEIGPCLRQGENVLRLSGVFDDTTDLEAAFLLGDFGVKFPATLTVLPEKLGFGGYAEKGLGYYGGGIVLHTGITGPHTIRVPKPMNAVAVRMEGEATASFYPYTQTVRGEKPLDVTVVLSRRNTFGPLHLKDATRYYADPSTNRCEVSDPQVVD